MNRIIFHVDVNSAYLSWEAARRISLGEEDIRLIPSVIGGDRDKRTGVVLAKSIPAKGLGIRTGEPIAMALRKCPGLFIARPDFRLYEWNSQSFMNLCCRYSPVVEKYSIDECFMDMGNMAQVFPDPIEAARQIKNEIKERLNFTVNVGIGSNKLLAKMASDFEKPDKIHTLFIGQIEEKLWPLPVRSLFSVGRVTAQLLEKAGIYTIGDLARSDVRKIQALAGMKPGQQIHNYANGIDDSHVLQGGREAKGYSNSTTLDKDITDAEDACKVLMALTDGAASRMRADGVKAYCVSVTVRDSFFKDRSHQRSLTEPTDITSEIYDISKTLFSELWNKKTPIRLLAVALTDLTKDECVQQSFFHDESKEKDAKIDKAVDSIRSKFGTDTIMRGSVLSSGLNVAKKHKAQMDSKIPLK